MATKKFDVQITLPRAPNTDFEAATKLYVDNVVQSIAPKDSCRVATTTNITLSGEQTIDSVSVVSGERVLVKNQTDNTQNGIHICNSGAWTRATDQDDPGEFPGAFTFIEEGTTNADSGWICTTDNPVTIGSSAITWSQFSGAGQITAGQGLTKTGNTLDVGAGNQISVDGTSVNVVDGAGSGLDADLLDGIDSTQFLRSDVADTATGQINFTNATVFTRAPANSLNVWEETTGSNRVTARFVAGGSRFYLVPGPAGVDDFSKEFSYNFSTARWEFDSAPYVASNRVLHEGDLGTLDAGTLDGLDSTQFLRSDVDDTFTGTTLTFSGDIQMSSDAYSVKSSVGGAEFAFDNTGTTSVIRSNNHTYIDIDYNNNATDKIFAVRHNAGTSELFRVQENGRVGIGSTSPEAMLDISGTVGSLAVLVDNNAWYSGEAGDGTNVGLIQIDNSDNTVVNAKDGEEIRFSVGAADYKATIFDNGNLVVGATDDKGARLTSYINDPSVYDGVTINSRAIYVFNEDATATSYSSLLFRVGNTGGAESGIIGLRESSNKGAMAFVTETGTGATFQEVMRITGDADVGIGIGTPTAKLDIRGSFYNRINSTGTLATFNQAGTGNIIEAQDNGSVVFVVKDGGRVGVGIEAPEGDIHAYRSAQGTAPLLKLVADNWDGGASWASGSVEFFGNHNGTKNDMLYIEKNGAGQFVIDNTGNVGIGTDTPEDQLHVVGGNILFEDADVGIKAKIGGTAYNLISRVAASNGINIGSNTASQGDISIVTDNGTHVFDPAGNVGIGTVSPVSKLHVYQNDSATSTSAGLTIEQDGTGDALIQFLLSAQKRWAIGLDNSDGDKFVIGEDADWAGGRHFVIDSSGFVGINATSPTHQLHLANLADRDGIRLNMSNNNAGISMTDLTNSRGYALINNRPNDVFVVQRTDGAGAFTSNLLAVGNTGNIGTRQTDLDKDIHIKGAAGDHSPAIKLEPGTTTVAGYFGRFQDDGNTTSGNAYYTYIANGGYQLNGLDRYEFWGENQYVNIQAILMSDDGFDFVYGNLTIDGEQVTMGRVAFISKSGTFTPEGNILAQGGTAALPGISFADDSNTGIFQTGANDNDLRFSVGGVERATLTNGGFLLLTVDPTANLHAATKQYVDNSISAIKYTELIGDGTSTSITVTHNLGTRAVISQVARASSPYDEIGVEIKRTTTNTLTIEFAEAPATDEFEVTVIG